MPLGGGGMENDVQTRGYPRGDTTPLYLALHEFHSYKISFTQQLVDY